MRSWVAYGSSQGVLNHCIASKNIWEYLGEFFRRITRKLSRSQEITATSHKLTRIVFYLLRHKGGIQRERF